MDHFRAQRMEGDFIFFFELEHVPRRGSARTFLGQMWGAWNEQGPITRVRIDGAPEGPETFNGPIEFIIQNGPEPKAWRRQGRDAAFTLLSGEALFEPIVPGVHYSVFDLQMPFIYWDDFDYAGPARVQGRSAQRFFIYPPENDPIFQENIDRVRLALDDGYNALLRIDFYDGDRPMSSFRIRRFKEVQGQYIVREIDLIDERARDRTKFTVNSASVGLQLPESTFDPEHQRSPIQLAPRFFEDL